MNMFGNAQIYFKWTVWYALCLPIFRGICLLLEGYLYHLYLFLCVFIPFGQSWNSMLGWPWCQALDQLQGNILSIYGDFTVVKLGPVPLHGRIISETALDLRWAWLVG